MLLDTLSKSARQAMLRALSQGQYQLLLGAGASRGSCDALGEPMPLANELAEQIAAEFGDSSEDPSLVEAYERAVRRKGARAVYKYLNSRFAGCDPSSWYEKLVTLPWARVWTLNIDDVYERAHSQYARQIGRQYDVINWDDLYCDVSKMRLQIVHLHGHVRDAEPKGLVFSILEYLNTVEAAHAWHRVFGDSFISSPYIIIGARLRDEYDLARVLRERKPPSNPPSLYISYSISPEMREDLLSWGFEPIQATAEDFISELAQLVEPAIMEQVNSWGAGGSSVELLRFSQQFELLKTNIVQPERKGHDFYSGSAPKWSDVVHNRDAIFSWVKLGADRAVKLLDTEDDSARLLLIWGRRFSGRSTGILRIARELSGQHVRIFAYRGDGRLDVDATYGYLKDSGEAVLIFDGVADFADDVDDLLSRCRRGDIRVLVVATEDEHRAPLVLARLDTYGLSDDRVIEIGPLDRSDARALISKLNRAGRLGKITPLKLEAQMRHFLNSGIFVGMAALEGGSGFRARILEEVDNLTFDWERHLVLLTSLVETLNYSIPVQLAAGAIGRNADDLLDAAQGDNSLSVLIEVDEALRLRPRMRLLLIDDLISRVGKDNVAVLLTNAITFARPYFNEKTQVSRSLTARIVAGLMKAKKVIKWVGRSNLDGWYEGLRELYGWNGRYWEQRAIAASLLGSYDVAESYAEKAVVLAPDSFRYNTLGRILIQKAVIAVSYSGDESERVYLRARQSLERAYALDRKNIVPLVTFLENSIKILEAGIGQDGAFGQAIVRDWSDWYANARLRHSAAISREIRETLDRLSRRWQTLMKLPGE